jgi:hypothetical protein
MSSSQAVGFTPVQNLQKEKEAIWYFSPKLKSFLFGHTKCLRPEAALNVESGTGNLVCIQLRRTRQSRHFKDDTTLALGSA